MAKLLHISCSPRPESESSAGAQLFLDGFRQARPDWDIDVADLVWEGARRPAGAHLADTGWVVTPHPTEQLYAEHGFVVPDNEMLKDFRHAITYISAELG